MATAKVCSPKRGAGAASSPGGAVQLDDRAVVEGDAGFGVVEVLVEAALGEVAVVVAHVLGVLDEGGGDADRLQALGQHGGGFTDGPF